MITRESLGAAQAAVVHPRMSTSYKGKNSMPWQPKTDRRSNLPISGSYTLEADITIQNCSYDENKAIFSENSPVHRNESGEYSAILKKVYKGSVIKSSYRKSLTTDVVDNPKFILQMR
jgi:hypothetical protein